MAVTKLRPHHFFCRRFLKAELPDREAEFREVERRIDGLIEADAALIEVAQGVDELCRVCPHCREDRCIHPQGDEEAVRKWDAILLKGLAVSYGDVKTSRQWGIVVEEQMPLDFCRTRCPSRSMCGVATALPRRPV